MTNVLKRFSDVPHWVFLFIIGVLVFIPFLGNAHLFDWDEINFAESAREMLLTHHYRTVQINFQPFYEKPPFFIWLQALSMSYFGVNEFAARIPNAFFGILTLITVYNVGRRYFDRDMGIWWALLFACSVLPQMYFKSGIIDPVFNYFIFLSLYFLFSISIRDDFEPNKMRRKNHRWYMIASALAAGVAVLTKGPVALGIIVMVVTILLLINKGKLNFNLGDLILWLLVVTLVIAAWLSFEIRANGLTFVHNFIVYQIRLFSTEDAGHGGPVYFHVLAVLLGCFPASVLCLDAFRRQQDDTLHQVSLKRWMIVLLVVVLVVFSIVKTKIIHYSSLSYFPVTFLGAYYIYHLQHGRWRWSWRQTVPMAVIGAAFAVAVGGAIWIGSHPVILSHIQADPFAMEAMKAKVYWTLSDLFVPIGLLVGMVAALILLAKKRIMIGMAALLLSTCLFTNLTLALIVPRIEKYSQAAMIEFLESRKLEDCYVEVAGFKSYAQLFYKDKQQPATPQELDAEYILTGPTSKPVYVVTRVDKLHTLNFLDRYEELYRKNGFVFLKKK
ncbi:MAG: glycosyltransferase family 39 protein [Bacteroidetes bacterium]|nr:glycosyltransferase family 39 protein [Bacteroidota bacterium]